MDAYADFNANVYAPNGTIEIGQDSAVVGAFIGNDVVVGSKATVTAANGFGEAPDTFEYFVINEAGLASDNALVEIKNAQIKTPVVVMTVSSSCRL